LLLSPLDRARSVLTYRAMCSVVGPCNPVVWVFSTSGFLRALAYLQSRKAKEAASEFQAVRDHRGVAPMATEWEMSQLGLGRAYAMQGDTTKARAAYQDFLTLWKDADPDIPILKQAKAEYARLQ
jgi:hypothetical protein